MKRGLWILIAAILIGAGAFMVTREQCGCGVGADGAAHDGASMLPELKWLRRELKLTDEQFAKVSELHQAYRPTCEVLCAKVAEAQKKVKSLAETRNAGSAELEAALQEQAAVHVECRKALLKHLHQTAAVMTPPQAQHYLDAMLPQVSGVDVEHMPEGH